METLVGLIVVGVVLAVALFKVCWKIAEPNEALIISGLHHRTAAANESVPGLGFQIVTGRGKLVIPGISQVRRLSLDLREAELVVDCVTHQGIPVGIKGVVIFKVGDDFTSIANAARRFLDQQSLMEARVHNVFAGHLRAIVGNLTMEELIRDREKLTALTRESSGIEMEKLGLIVDSLQIQELDDPTGYIENLGKPHAAAVASQARIAQAAADRDATLQEQMAEAAKAEARRNTEIKKAGFQAEVDDAAAKAGQAGPLADARARQEVVVQGTKVAELEAQLEEQKLQAIVRKPADAEAYQQVTLAKAKRDARITQAEAERQEVQLRAAANANRVKVEAEAQAEQVRLSAAAQAEEVRLTAAAQAEEVRLAAAAHAESVRAVGDAEAAATEAKGRAEGEAIRAKGLAEGEAINARAEALAENQDAVIGQQLAENWPAIVEAAAKPFGDIDQMIVLNGATGLSEALAQAMSQGVAGLQMARQLLSGANGLKGNNGSSAGGNGRADGSKVGADTRPEDDGPI